MSASLPGRAVQLAWEARFASLAAGAAFLSAALAAASVAVQAALIGGSPDDEREALVLIDRSGGELLASLGLQIGAYVLLVGALYYLLRATTSRRPETPGFATGLVLMAPVLLAVGSLMNQFELNRVAEEFVSSERTNKVADMLLDDRNGVGGGLALGGTLCLALSFVLVSLNAMRAGLLSRFMGGLGIVIGALLVLPLLPGGIVQTFWLVALGVLFLGRWPGGRGPAWEAGEAVAWPSAAEARAEALAGALAAERPAASDEAPARPASRKRKRKRG